MSRRNKSPKEASDESEGETTGRQGEECYAYTHTLAEQARREPIRFDVAWRVIRPTGLLLVGLGLRRA